MLHPQLGGGISCIRCISPPSYMGWIPQVCKREESCIQYMVYFSLNQSKSYAHLQSFHPTNVQGLPRDNQISSKKIHQINTKNIPNNSILKDFHSINRNQIPNLMFNNANKPKEIWLLQDHFIPKSLSSFHAHITSANVPNLLFFII